MNLDQIATKCFILALFIRDDGQRLLLGDGYYDFNQKLQHFQGNTIANDVVEIQGDSGQLLAGQVMRSGAQKFEGYIGDATTNRQTIEQKRSDFMAFFRIKHFYKVIYIFPDGTAIQRQRGYLTDAPTIPEIFQRFPEYSVALNFEDANYYEYAEDTEGNEIYAHIAELALSGNTTGGLIWDEIGAVTNGISWSGIQTAQGEYIQITNELDIPAKLASVEMLGKAEQNGTPTPASPQPISVVTGENVVKIEGKNLFNGVLENGSYYTQASLGNRLYNTTTIPITVGEQYTVSLTGDSQNLFRFAVNMDSQPLYKASQVGGLLDYDSGWETGSFSFTATYPYIGIIVSRQDNGDLTPSDISNCRIQLELGSTVTTYEPYHGQEFEVNLGKNLFDPFVISTSGITVEEDGTLKLSDNTSAIGYKQTGKTLAQLAPSLKIGDIVYLYLETDWTGKQIYGSHIGNWANGQYRTITAEMLADSIIIYGGYQTTTTIRIMITKALDSTYAPYFSPIELAKIGNYQDRIFKADSKWYIEKQVGKVLGSSASWGNNGTNANFTQGVINGLDVGANISVNDFADMYCANMLASGSSAKTQSQTPSGSYRCNGTTALSQIRVNIGVDYAPDWATFQSLANNLVLYYALATPTTTEITNEALIAQLDALESASLYVGVNNIGTETQNAVPTLKIEYYTEIDLDGAGYEWEPGDNTAKTTVTVAGVDSAWPIWTVQGGAQNPTLTNITTGQTITWQGFVPEGQTLTINMAEMTADLAGANVFEYITGEWIRLAPGNNTLVYTAGNADKPSTLSWNGVLA